MKKLLGIGVVVLTLMFVVSSPVLACNEGGGGDHTNVKVTVKDNNALLGCGNVGIQGNKNHHNTVIGGDVNVGPTVNGGIKNTVNNNVTAKGGNATATGGNACSFSLSKGGEGGAGGNASATIEKGAVKNTNNNTNTNTNTNNNDLSNRNTNVNANCNKVSNDTSVAVEGDTTNVSTTVEGDTVTVEGDYVPRAFANPGSVTYPGAPEFYGPDSPSSNVMDLRDILSMKNTYDRHVLSVTTKKADMRFRARYLVPTMNKRDRSPDDSVSVYLGKPTAGDMVAMLMVRADDTDTTTFEVMAKAALLALDVKADSLYVVAYSAEKVVKTSGWGVGFGHTTSTMNSAGDIGTVNTGGTGFQKGESGLKGKPWVHAIAVRIP